MKYAIVLKLLFLTRVKMESCFNGYAHCRVCTRVSNIMYRYAEYSVIVTWNMLFYGKFGFHCMIFRASTGENSVSRWRIFGTHVAEYSVVM